MIRLVICDFDDTLALERDFVSSGFAACSKYLSQMCPGNTPEAVLQLLWEEFRFSPRKVFDRAIKRIPGASEEDARACVELYRNHFPTISYQPDVREFLRQLNARRIHSAIVTDGSSTTQHNKIIAVGADIDFEKIIVTGDHPENWHKPSPLPFEALRTYFGVEYPEMLYIGDNPRKDFAVAGKIPIRTARILRPGGIYADAPYIDEIREDARISSLPEIFDTPLFK